MSKSRYSCNFFINDDGSQDVEGYSYFMGFCMGDASVKAKGEKNRNGNLYDADVIQVLSTDRDIVEKLHSRLKCDTSIRVMKPSYKTKSGVPCKDCYVFNLCSQNARYFIERGLSHDKEQHSFNRLKEFDRDVDFRYWLLGLFDADGSIYLGSNRNGGNRIEFFSILCREKLLNELKEYYRDCRYRLTESPTGKKVYRFNLRRKDYIDLLSWSEKNSTIRLDRKVEIFKKDSRVVKSSTRRMSSRKYIRHHKQNEKNGCFAWYFGLGPKFGGTQKGFATEGEAASYRDSLMGYKVD